MATYDSLASLIGSFPELAVFRKFGDLATTVLLMKQAELLHLLEEFKMSAELDANDITADVAISWEKMNGDNTAAGSQRRKRLDDLGPKLKSYYELLLLTKKVLRLKKPRRSTVNFLNSWLTSPEHGNRFLDQAGIEADVWEETTFTDLVALSQSDDGFSLWLGDLLSPLHHRCIGHKFKREVAMGTPGRLWHYTHSSFELVGNSICMLLSSMLPVLSIFVLYYLDNMPARLMAITLFSLIFSSLMTFVVQGRRYDVFAATTAFAAVQVVFVGGIDVRDKH